MNVEHRDVKVDVDTIVDILRHRVGEHNATDEFPAYIGKAPSTLRKYKTSFFTPQVVSIGPLHRKDRNLKKYKVTKAAFVHDLLFRHSTSLTRQAQTLKACVEKVGSVIEKIKRCYANIGVKSDNKLTEMMVMDACFILEFIHKKSSGSNLLLRDQDQYIAYDLVLLENQIPFFVLEDIYECLTYPFKESRLHITEFLLPLLKYVNLFKRRVKVRGDDIRSNTIYYHILDYLHHCYQPREDIRSGHVTKSMIHSAVKLNRAEVNIEPKYDQQWPMAMVVKWNRSKIFGNLSRPTLTMPALVIDDFTELVFRNLIAYEQSYGLGPYVTSYARAMNMLIDTDEDVAELVRSEVIVNQIGSNYDAAYMIKSLCLGVGQDHFYYDQQFELLDRRVKNYLPSKIAKLMHAYYQLKRDCYQLKLTYFNSPWSAIALFAGINIFFLTWVQAIYTVMSYYTK